MILRSPTENENGEFPFVVSSVTHAVASATHHGGTKRTTGLDTIFSKLRDLRGFVVSPREMMPVSKYGDHRLFAGWMSSK